MNKLYNGFNNGRDKSDGVGGREVNHGTNKPKKISNCCGAEGYDIHINAEICLHCGEHCEYIEPDGLTKEEIIEKYPVGYIPSIKHISQAMEEYTQQELTKERKKLIGALQGCLSIIEMASHGVGFQDYKLCAGYIDAKQLLTSIEENNEIE